LFAFGIWGVSVGRKFFCCSNEPFLIASAGGRDTRHNRRKDRSDYLIDYTPGFALNIVGSFVKGLMPLRSFVAAS